MPLDESRRALAYRIVKEVVEETVDMRLSKGDEVGDPYEPVADKLKDLLDDFIVCRLLELGIKLPTE